MHRRDPLNAAIIYDSWPQGVNDSEKDALELTKLVSGFRYTMINLMYENTPRPSNSAKTLKRLTFICSPFNPWPGTKYECSTEDQILAFQKILIDNNLAATIRWPSTFPKSHPVFAVRRSDPSSSRRKRDHGSLWPTQNRVPQKHEAKVINRNVWSI